MFQIGDFVTFDYKKGTTVNDDHPRVLVLHQQWACSDKDTSHQCLHGLNFNYLTNDEIEYILAVINPAEELRIVQRNKAVAKKMEIIHPLLSLDITSPYDFYQRFVRPFIKPKKWDPYRRYRLDKIVSPHIITRKSVMVGDEKDTMFNRFARRTRFMRGKRLPFGWS